MKSTRLADLFYKWDINPFYVVTSLVFLIPLISLLFFSVFLRYQLLYSLGFTIIVFLSCSILFYLYFHRNPVRNIPKDDNAILSPADGKVVYVKKIENGEIIESVKKKHHMKLTELLDVNTDSSSSATGFIIGIEMRLFDVHITRSPVTGEKLLDHHVSGKIVPMNNPLFEFINDRETVVLKQKTNQNNNSNSLQVAVVQIATFITRTVKSFVKNKTHIVQGESLGIIRLGSQVDLVIFSKNVDILVEEQDRVYAGITKIAEIAAV